MEYIRAEKILKKLEYFDYKKWLRNFLHPKESFSFLQLKAWSYARTASNMAHSAKVTHAKEEEGEFENPASYLSDYWSSIWAPPVVTLFSEAASSSTMHQVLGSRIAASSVKLQVFGSEVVASFFEHQVLCSELASFSTK